MYKKRYANQKPWIALSFAFCVVQPGRPGSDETDFAGIEKRAPGEGDERNRKAMPHRFVPNHEVDIAFR